MSESIDFATTHFYNTLASGITLPTKLFYGSEAVEFESKLDTGSSHCIFKRSYGEVLGIDVESSPAIYIGTVTGSFSAHLHSVELEVLDIRTEAQVYFAADDHFRRNVLGRIGWLDRVKLGLVDYEGKILLSPGNA